MRAKRYLFILWLAFAAPWIAGTGYGVYAESQPDPDEAPASAAADCPPGARECSGPALAKLTARAIDVTGRAFRMDSARSADTAPRTHDLVDAAFVFGPPVLLLVACALAFLLAGRRRRTQRTETTIKAPVSESAANVADSATMH